MSEAIIKLAHGSGSGLTQRLVRELFLRYFQDPELARLCDGAVLPTPQDACAGGRLAFTTDSYVVSPLEFPGGNIGKLAVCGTVNDLAVMGAKPLWLSTGWILEEGLPLETLERLAAAMAATAGEVGVRIVTGDTKVVPHGLADGVYVNTAGVGVVPAGVNLGPEQVQDGDVVLVNGYIGDHGMAVLLKRQGIAMASDLQSDCAPLHGLAQCLLDAGINVHCLRDATRGGVAGVLCEIAEASSLGIEIEEAKLPIRPQVAAAGEMLGLDPLFIANEGKLVAFVSPQDAERALAIWRKQPYGREAVAVGRVVKEHGKMVLQVTPLGTGRIIRVPMGELLPRIC